MKKKHLALQALVVLFCMTAAHAAELRALREQHSSAMPVSQWVASLGLDAGSTFAELESYATVGGTRKVRMQQRYQGVPVYGRSIVVEQDAAGNVLAVDGAVLRGAWLDLTSVTPGLSPEQALAALRAAMGFLPTAATALRNERADLYVYPDQDGRVRLAYLVSYVLDQPGRSRPTAIVDARTGQMIRQWDGLARMLAISTGKPQNEGRLQAQADGSSAAWPLMRAPGRPIAAYMALASGPGGNLKTGKYHYGKEYPPLAVEQEGNTCTLKNKYVETYDMKGGGSGKGSLASFICPDSLEPEVNGGYGPMNDAHHFAGVVRDMYQTWFGKPPLTVGRKLRMRVHHADPGSADWDGEAANFGDGGDKYYPMVSLDIVSHEIAHGFTELHAASGGALQTGMVEAFADMAGEAAKFYARGQNDFLVGADVTKAGIGAIRDMCRPLRDGFSIDHARDFRAGMDEHHAAGVYNKAFCLLAKTSGWDTRKAFEVFYGANLVYWTADDDFDSGACGVEKAAVDKGYQKSDVTKAFRLVGVRCSRRHEFGDGLQLRNGVPITGLSGSKDAFLKYTVGVPWGSSHLRISLAGGGGDADLYVKYGAEPNDASYDCHSNNGGNVDVCEFAAPGQGVYHIKVFGFTDFSGMTLQATWKDERDEL